MRRREFLSALGATASWQLTAHAQQMAMPTVGFAVAGAAAALRSALAAFEAGLKETGYIRGQNVTVEYRFAEGQFDRFPGFMSEFVRRQASVIVTTSSAGAFAAKNAISTIPIVFSIGDDPVVLGLVLSLNRPGGNVTGVYQFTTGLEEKRLGLLRELVPSASTLGVLVHPDFEPSKSQTRDVGEAASKLGVKLVVVRANAESEFDAAFSTVAEQKAGGLLIAASPLFNSRQQQLILLAARYRLPAIYEWRQMAESGGLMSYGASLGEAYHQAGLYTGRVLKGAKPADLPVVQVTKFEFVINLSTAKTLGIEVPGALSARADEIIE